MILYYFICFLFLSFYVILLLFYYIYYICVKQTRKGLTPTGPRPGPILDWAASGPGPNGARASATGS